MCASAQPPLMWSSKAAARAHVLEAKRKARGHSNTDGNSLQGNFAPFENPQDLELLRELWDSELVVFLECLEEIVCYPSKKTEKVLL